MNIHIETDRLILRNFVEDDAEALFEMDSKPEVHKFLGNNPTTEISQAKEVVKYILDQYKRNDVGRLAVILKETNKFIGWTGIKFVDDITLNGNRNFYDLGYRFNSDFWNQGFAYESAKAAYDSEIKRLNIQTVYASAAVGNIASRKIIEKIGLKEINNFTFEGIECKWYKKNINI